MTSTQDEQDWTNRLGFNVHRYIPSTNAHWVFATWIKGKAKDFWSSALECQQGRIHGLVLDLTTAEVSAVATFCAYYFARSAGWIVGGMQVVMAWAAAFGFGVNPGPSPLIAQVAQMFKIGPQILQLTVGAKYWAESPDNGPEDWGVRVQLTFLFPK